MIFSPFFYILFKVGNLKMVCRETNFIIVDIQKGYDMKKYIKQKSKKYIILCKNSEMKEYSNSRRFFYEKNNNKISNFYIFPLFPFIDF